MNENLCMNKSGVWLRTGRLAMALGLAALLFWALMGVLNRPLKARPLALVLYVDGTNGSDAPGCGLGTHALACATIQYALANRAADGDIVRVAAGTYNESVLIAQDVTLQGGWNIDFTVWDPFAFETTVAGQTGTGVYAVTVATGTTTLLDGLTVFQGDDGVHVHPDAGARLRNLRVYGSDDEGIESNGDWLVVSNTLVYSTGDNGILVEAGRAEVYSVTVHDTGLVVTFNSRRGIYLRGAGPDVVSGTLVYNTPDDAIRARGATDVSVTGNRVFASMGDGIQIDAVNTALASGNTVFDVDNEGIQIAGSGAVTVENNVVYRAGADGILSGNAFGTALIRNNAVYSSTALNADGIQVDVSVVATVQDNTVYDVSDDAIDFKGASGVVAGNVAYDVFDAGIQVENASQVWITDNVITRTITDTANAIYVGPGVSATIEANRVTGAGADGVNFQGTTGQIRHNVIRQTGDQGININAGNTTVFSNTVSDTHAEGVRVRSGSVVWLEDNLIYNVLGVSRDGIHVEPNAAATLLGNTVYNAADDGIAFNGTTGVISGNLVHNNAASGLDIDADAVTVFANRVFANQGFGIELEQAADFEVFNNLVGENVSGGVLAAGVTTGTLVNNTLVGHPTGRMGVGIQVISPTVTLTSANNIVISFTRGVSVVSGAGVVTTYDDVWGNGLDYSGVVSGVGSIQENPLLRDVAARNYGLRYGSPCIDAGLASLAPVSDFEGDERIDGPDIGADELVGLSLVKTAPHLVEPGEPITYTLTVINHLDVTVTTVLVTDVVPAGATWITSTDGTLGLDDVMQWVIPQIAPDGGFAQVGFVVTATHTLTNARYRVVSTDQGVSTRLGPPVVTEVFKGRLYLPLVLK